MIDTQVVHTLEPVRRMAPFLRNVRNERERHKEKEATRYM